MNPPDVKPSSKNLANIWIKSTLPSRRGLFDVTRGVKFVQQSIIEGYRLRYSRLGYSIKCTLVSLKPSSTSKGVIQS